MSDQTDKPENNRKDSEQNFTVEDRQIEAYKMDIQGYKNKEIATEQHRDLRERLKTEKPSPRLFDFLCAPSVSSSEQSERVAKKYYKPEVHL